MTEKDAVLLWLAMFVALVVLPAVIFSPPMLMLAIVKGVCGLALDTGQMWAFSILLFLLFWLVTGLTGLWSGDLPAAFAFLYVLLASLIVVIGLVSTSGFHVAWFRHAFSLFYPPELGSEMLSAVFVFFLFVLVPSLILGPGMLVLGTIKDLFGLGLDGGQMWTFSIVSAGLLWMVIRVGGQISGLDSPAFSTTLLYVFLSLLTIGIALISVFGFHVTWFTHVLSWFFHGIT